MKCTTVTLALLLLAAIAAAADPATPEQLFEQLYGRQYRAAASSPEKTDDLALAGDLLAAARQSEDPATVVLLTDKVDALVGEWDEGLALAIEAIKLQAYADPALAADARDRLIELLPRRYAAATGPARQRAGSLLVDLLTDRIEQHLDVGETDEALVLTRRAVGVAAGLSPRTRDKVAALLDRVTDLRRADLKIDTLKRRIEAAPDNTRLIDQLATVYLAELDDADQAAKFADLAGDAMAANLALATADPAELSPAELIQRGDWYAGPLYRQATPTMRARMLIRAADAYAAVLERDGVAELSRLRAETALQRVNERLAELGGAALAADGWNDLMPRIDPTDDAAAGQWRKTEDRLIGSGKVAALRLPIDPTEPYRVSIRVARLNDEGLIGLILPVGDREALAFFGQTGGLAGLLMIDNKYAPDNGTAVRLGELPAGTSVRFEAHVERDGDRAAITTSINGKPIVKWRGDVASLSLSPTFAAVKHQRRPTIVGLGATVAVTRAGAQTND